MIQNRILLLVFVVTMVLGCTPNLPDGLPTLYPCQITLTQSGNPLEGAFISLVHEEKPVIDESRSQQNWIQTGTTNANGKAVVYTNARFSGAPAGRFKVVIEKKVAAESQFGPPPPEDSPDYAAWEDKTMSEILPLFSLVELKYTNSEETPITIEIKKGKNSFAFDLGETVKVSLP